MLSVSVVGCQNCTFKAQRNAPAECPLKNCSGKLISVGIQNEEDMDLIAVNVGQCIKNKYASIDIITCNCISGMAEINSARVLRLGTKNEVSNETRKFQWNQASPDCGATSLC